MNTNKQMSVKVKQPTYKEKIDLKPIFSYLQDLKDPEVILNDEKAILYLGKIHWYTKSFKNKLPLINTGLKHDFCPIIFSLIETSYDTLSSYLNDVNSAKKDKKYDKAFRECIMFMEIVWNFVNHSVRFNIEAHKVGAVRILFKVINDETLINLYGKESNSNASKLIRFNIATFVDLSREYTSFSNKWKKENPVERILTLSEKLKHKDECQLCSYVILANISEDEEINQLEGLRQIIPVIANLIGELAARIKTKKNLVRIKVNLNEKNSNELHEIANLVGDLINWHLLELLEALYHMACNDTIKYEIYKTNKINFHLRRIIYNGNEIEIEYALKLLWQLCFDKRIAEDVQNDQKLMNKLQDIIMGYGNEPKKRKMSEGLIRNIYGIFWLVNKKSKEPLFQRSANLGQPDSNTHIMISYNRDSREVCLKIKEELEKSNFKVWIDVEEIHGSSLESMAKAIENSSCVLICMSEKYKMSSNCRAEAEYTFQLNKPFVPLIMQDNYKPDGWLGILLGSRIFIDFTKYEFSECIRRLLLEIDNYHKSEVGSTLTTVDKPSEEANNTNNNIETTTNHIENDKVKKAEDWTERDVKRWLKEKHINKQIVQNVSPCNGKILNQLYSIKCNAPEFFYKSITSNKVIPTKDIAVFSYELKLIFQ